VWTGCWPCWHRRRCATLILFPEGEIHDRTAEAGASRENLIRPNVPGKLKPRDKRLPTKLRLKIHAIGGVGQPHVGLRQKFGACDVFVLDAFRGGQDSDLLGGVLLQSESDRLLQSEAQRVARWIGRKRRGIALCEQSGGEKQ